MIPLIYPPIPPMSDLFGHIGRFRVELDGETSPWLRQYYSFHWALIGNLGADLLVLPLGRLIGLEPAVKLIVLAIPPLTAGGFLWVAREVHGRVPPTAFLALPFIYSYPFLFGFLNFALSIAFAFLAFGLWLRLGRANRIVLRAGLFAPISLLLFFCHTYGWGVLGIMCFGAETARLREDRGSWPTAVTIAAVRVSVMALPLVVLLVWRSGAAEHTTGDFFNWAAKLQWIHAALRDRWKLFDVGSLMAAMLIPAAWLIARKLEPANELAMCLRLLAITFVLMPRILFASAYADMRLVPYVLAVGILALRPKPDAGRRSNQILAVVAVSFFVFRLCGNTISLAWFSDDQQQKLQALDHVPVGSRVISLVGLPCTEEWPLRKNVHLSGMVIARKQGFSNDQWIVDRLNLLQLRSRAVPGFEMDPSQLVQPKSCQDEWHRTLPQAVAALPRHQFDFLWTIDLPAGSAVSANGLQLVWRGPNSALYRAY